MRSVFLVATIAAATVAVFLPQSAAAAVSAYTTVAANMRAGPGVRYSVVAVVPRRQRVTVYGCLPNRRWCDVRWRRHRGWISSRLLSRTTDRRRFYDSGYVFPPVIYFDFGTYHDRWYRDRPFYRQYQGQPWRRRRNP